MDQGNHNTTNDTRLTKIFVGGLAWESQRDTMRRYFEQFGEIVEAVVITDRNTGRSKGYGFVTFMEAEAAMRACQNMNPVIDGRRTHCNLACLGAQKHRLPTQQHTGQFPFPYYGFSQEGMYPVNYCYNHHLYGGPSSTGMFHGFYPFYAQPNVTQGSNQAYHQGLSFQYTTPPILSSPASLALSLSSSSSSTSTSETKTSTTTTMKKAAEASTDDDGHEAS